MTSVQNFQAEA